MPHLLHSLNSSARTTRVNSLRPQICFIAFLWPVLPLFSWSVQNWAQEHMLSSTRATAKIVFFLGFIILQRSAFLTGACQGVTVDCKLCDLWHFGGHCKIDLQVLYISLRPPSVSGSFTQEQAQALGLCMYFGLLRSPPYNHCVTFSETSPLVQH